MAASARVLHLITGLAVGGAQLMLPRLANRSHLDRLSYAVVGLGRKGARVPRRAPMYIRRPRQSHDGGCVSGAAHPNAASKSCAQSLDSFLQRLRGRPMN